MFISGEKNSAGLFIWRKNLFNIFDLNNFDAINARKNEIYLLNSNIYNVCSNVYNIIILLL